MLMQEKVDNMIGISNTILQLSQDKGVLLDSMTSNNMLNGVFDHHKLYCHPKCSLWKSFEEFNTDRNYYGYSQQEAVNWILEDIDHLSLEKIEEPYWK